MGLATVSERSRRYAHAVASCGHTRCLGVLVFVWQASDSKEPGGVCTCSLEEEAGAELRFGLLRWADGAQMVSVGWVAVKTAI